MYDCGKTRTVRLGDKSNKYKKEDFVDTTIGWRPSLDTPSFVAEAEITSVKVMTLGEYFARNFEMRDEGEIERVILSLIYHKMMDDSDVITVIEFDADTEIKE